MSDFLIRKPPKVILDDKTLEDKKRVKIHPSEVYKLVQQNKLPHKRIGKQIFIL